jgi:hypothetical protein
MLEESCRPFHDHHFIKLDVINWRLWRIWARRVYKRQDIRAAALCDVARA